MRSEESDAALVARLADADEGALEELLRRHAAPLARFVFRQTSGRDVEDLCQETWLRVIRHADRFDPGKVFSTWLFQIAINLCRDWHRRSRAAEPLGEWAGSSRPSERADARLDAQRLLAMLPEPQREVLILRFYHDMSEEQAAAVVGCPRGTVKSRLHNAIRRLSALLGDEGR